MQYAILSAPNAQELAEQVNQRLARGWVLYGNPIFTGTSLLVQAMTYVQM
jgi:hypothetical protein